MNFLTSVRGSSARVAAAAVLAAALAMAPLTSASASSVDSSTSGSTAPTWRLPTKLPVPKIVAALQKKTGATPPVWTSSDDNMVFNKGLIVHRDYSMWFVNQDTKAKSYKSAIALASKTLEKNHYTLASAAFNKKLSKKSGLKWSSLKGFYAAVYHNGKYIVVVNTGSTSMIDGKWSNKKSDLTYQLYFNFIRLADAKKARATCFRSADPNNYAAPGAKRVALKLCQKAGIAVGD
ncbi:hypothetical protein [Amnibacterium endophyticum]|uniref:Uncharacterized protein n=1 Tax=Amnibacterium endophyticum TaxID=2109337 RepID=A0ABW4LBI9_9MICO